MTTVVDRHLRTPAPMHPPQYHLESFWEERFNKESHFEWLGDGQRTILPLIRDFVLQPNYDSEPPRLLQIGVGTSMLSDQIIDIYQEKYGDVGGATIVNTDFAQRAVTRGMASESAREHKSVRWERADLLIWRDVVALLALLGTKENSNLFAIVVDKSTSDAISCADNIVVQFQVEGQSPQAKILSPSTIDDVFPLVKQFLTQQSRTTISFLPIEILALHLAAVVEPDGIWLALSYSQDRFQFLEDKTNDTARPALQPSMYWHVERVKGVDAPSGLVKEDVYTPQVQHYVYVLRRTAVRVDVGL